MENEYLPANNDYPESRILKQNELNETVLWNSYNSYNCICMEDLTTFS